MSLKEVIIEIVIPLVAGFIGGSIGSIVVVNIKFRAIGFIINDKRKMLNKNTKYQNVGEIYNGDRSR